MEDLFKQLESELVPTDASVTRPKRKRNPSSKPKKTKKPKEPEDPAKERFTGLDPFKDSASFVSFYRSVLKTVRKNAKFDSFESDARHAAVILDKLIERGRVEDRDFLKHWIEYFAYHKLKGRKSQNLEKTSIIAFGETFEEYDSKAITTR